MYNYQVSKYAKVHFLNSVTFYFSSRVHDSIQFFENLIQRNMSIFSFYEKIHPAFSDAKINMNINSKYLYKKFLYLWINKIIPSLLTKRRTKESIELVWASAGNTIYGVSWPIWWKLCSIRLLAAAAASVTSTIIKSTYKSIHDRSATCQKSGNW